MLFNINEMVRVKLTDHGRAVHAADHAKFWAVSGLSSPPVYVPPEEDADGWSRWQLWHLMELFGPHTGLCAPNCFETTIEIVEEAALQPGSIAAPSEDPMDAVRKMCR